MLIRFFLILLFSLCIRPSLQAQIRLRPGMSFGPNFSLPAGGEQTFSDGFFTSGKVGITGGVNLSLQAGEHFWSRIGTNYARTNFLFRRTSATDLRVENSFKFNAIEIPLQVGFTGYLGSLKHREYVGVGFNSLLRSSASLGVGGDSAAVYTYTTEEPVVKNSYLNFNFGIEVGSEFDNDGSIFFGLAMRYNPETQYQYTFRAGNFPKQILRSNANFVMLEITYYFPRFSYWFKRDFTY
jgi:hypothetical protein